MMGGGGDPSDREPGIPSKGDPLAGSLLGMLFDLPPCHGLTSAYQSHPRHIDQSHASPI